jgi:hypothetical protein
MNKRRFHQQRQLRNQQSRRRMQYNSLSMIDADQTVVVQNEVNEHREVDQENDLDDEDKS